MGEGEKQRNALLQAQAWLERQVAIASGQADMPDEDYADMFNAVLSLIEDALDEPTGWQPIETAPKDGTRVLAIWGKHGTQIIYWYSWEERPEYLVKAGACWKPENQRCPINATPTHWMPLPHPPE